jgi:hypothetical protein
MKIWIFIKVILLIRSSKAKDFIFHLLTAPLTKANGITIRNTGKENILLKLANIMMESGWNRSEKALESNILTI